jgi:predicted glycosyltransferase
MGMKGEVESTLTYLKTRGTTLVLGLRDVMDAPHLLDAEWKRKNVMPKIAQYYDHIWVYGPPDFYDPLVGLETPEAVRNKMNFVGFLQRNVPREETVARRPEGDYVLVTTGGGGDGADLVRDVLNAYKEDRSLDHKALVVLGPYMPARKRFKLTRKASTLPFVEVIEFDNRMEELVAGAKAVVAMGGYNTYCEILSFDKPALIVPRVQPREEQLIRATRATELGLIDMLRPEESADPMRMADALRRLLVRQPPSITAHESIRLEGLPHISQIVGRLFDRRHPDHLTVVKG